MSEVEILAAEVAPQHQTTGLVRRTARDAQLVPVMDVALAKRRLEELQEFCAGYLQESKDGGNDGGDFGVIPGAGAGKKKVLLKSGADKLCDVYGLADRYRILLKVEDFANGLFDYTIECELVRKTDEMFVGTGIGSCSSWESKYRWRESKRKCPQCQAEAIIKGKEEYGGGWLCWNKKGGCGAKFSELDPAIMDQKPGRVENEDIIDTKNTVLKMAKKRAKIDAVIGVTRSSGIFTQDLEETVSERHEERHEVAAPSSPPAGETHEQKIARVKAEALIKAKAAQSVAPVAAAPVPAAPAKQGVEREPDHEPFRVPVPVPVPAPAVSDDGRVQIVSINVRNGPTVVKDGKSGPSWILYVIAFSHKVEAKDKRMVADATTFDEKLAKEAEDARDAKGFVKPVVEPGKKGSYNLMRFE